MKPLALVLIIAIAAVAAGAADADDRAPTAGEAAVIAKFKTVINHTLDDLGAASGLQERDLNRQDIPPDGQVYGSDEGQFIFYGDISRFYEGAPVDNTAKMQALATRLQAARDSASQQKIIAEIQALGADGQNEPAHLLINSSHNVPYFAIDGDEPRALDHLPAGTCAAYEVKAAMVANAKAYNLEFCDPAAFKRDDASGFTRYHFAHNDGFAHIEDIEIHIEGTPDIVDSLLKDYDWTQVRKALTE